MSPPLRRPDGTDSPAAAVRSWDDDLHEEAVRELGPHQGRALAAGFADVIPEAYKANTSAATAVTDVTGHYDGAGLLPGRYVVTATAQGCDPGVGS